MEKNGNFIPEQNEGTEPSLHIDLLSGHDYMFGTSLISHKRKWFTEKEDIDC